MGLRGGEGHGRRTSVETICACGERMPPDDRNRLENGTRQQPRRIEMWRENANRGEGKVVDRLLMRDKHWSQNLAKTTLNKLRLR